MENVGDVDRRLGLLRVDAVLDSVHVLAVGDVEDLPHLQTVGGVGTVDCTEVILVVFCKQGEDLCHVPLVKSIDEEDDDSDGTPNKALRRAWPSPNGFLNKGLFKVKAKSPCAECPV